jgi:hypothetical protein
MIPLDLASAVFGIIAAALWFWSAKVIRHRPQMYTNFTPESDPFSQESKFASKLSAAAALATGGSALFMALSTLMRMHS